jgi:hypothetical protein
MRIVLTLALLGASLISISARCDNASSRLTDEQIKVLDHCASRVVPIRLARGQFVWKHLLLGDRESLAISASHSGKLIAFNGRGLLAFDSEAYAPPKEIPMNSGLVALAVSDRGVIAWLQSDNTKDNSPLELHVLRGDRQSSSPTFPRQPWKVPRTWPELYFVGERLYISEQGGKLTEADIDAGGHLKLAVEVPPTQSVDMTAPLAGGGYFQYRWSTPEQHGPRVVSSVTLFSSLDDLKAGKGNLSTVTNPVQDWQAVGDRVIFLSSHFQGPIFDPLVQLVRKSDGRQIAQLDYPDCTVTALDIEEGGAKAAIMLHEGVIQIVDTRNLRILDQIALPQSPDFGGAETLVAIGKNRFLVSTVEGVALVDAGE